MLKNSILYIRRLFYFYVLSIISLYQLNLHYPNRYKEDRTQHIRDTLALDTSVSLIFQYMHMFSFLKLAPF